MKKITFIFGLSVVISIFSIPVSAEPDPNFHVYLMIGQSNMEGAATIEAQDRETNSRVMVLQDEDCSMLGVSYGQWRVASPPLIRCLSNLGLGPGDTFGKTMADSTDTEVTIGLAGAAYGGQKIEYFLKNCDTYNACTPSYGSTPNGFHGGYAWLLDVAKKAQQKGVIKGVIFHQGESNTGDQNWPGRVNQLVTDLRNDLGIGNIPFIAGELPYTGCCSSHNTLIRQLPSVISNAHYVTAEDLNIHDQYHWDSAGVREMGRRYASKMQELVDTSAADNTSEIDNGDDNTITVRMKGVAGDELVSLQVGNTTISTWTADTYMSDYSVITNATGEIRVALTNDDSGRDVQVDYIVVNGVVRQAEDQDDNTGAWGNGSCGGASYSEWLHCNGSIGFGSVGGEDDTNTDNDNDNDNDTDTDNDTDNDTNTDNDTDTGNDPVDVATYKPRVINTTDIGGDPDDEQSMVRQLVMSNEFDLEGLIATTGCWRKNVNSTSPIDKIVDAYGEALPNLQIHADGFPSYEYLNSISVLGQQGYGMGDVGEGKDSAGSELIITAVDKDDPRPVWVTCWGGCNTVAQAIWKVQNTRSSSELDKFLSKLRVYDVLGQDDAGTWIAKTFPNLTYIRATGVYGWAPSDSWIDNNVQNHGPLGAVYPNRKYATEGDTPAFLHLYPNGLHDPDMVDQGGWGGRFDPSKKEGIRGMDCMAGEDAKYDPYYMYGNTSEGANAINRWSSGYNNDFEARMDWSVTSNYSDANHHPVAVVNGSMSREVLEMTASPGSSVELSANGSSDPDGDELNYSWSFDEKPSSYNGSVTIQGGSSETAYVEIPSNASGKSIHVILEMHDSGSPNLYAYRRVIINGQ